MHFELTKLNCGRTVIQVDQGVRASDSSFKYKRDATNELNRIVNEYTSTWSWNY